MFYFKRRTLKDPTFQNAVEKGKQLIALIKSFEYCSNIVVSSCHPKDIKNNHICFQVHLNGNKSLYFKGELRRFFELQKTNSNEYYDKFDENVNRIIREFLIGESFYKEKLELLKSYTKKDEADIVVDGFYYDDIEMESSVYLSWGWLYVTHMDFFYQQFQGTSKELAEKRRGLLIEELNKAIYAIPARCFGSEASSKRCGTNQQGSTTLHTVTRQTVAEHDALARVFNTTFQSFSHNDTSSVKEKNNKKCTVCNGTGLITRTQKTIFGMLTTNHRCRNCNGTGQSNKKSKE